MASHFLYTAAGSGHSIHDYVPRFVYRLKNGFGDIIPAAEGAIIALIVDTIPSSNDIKVVEMPVKRVNPDSGQSVMLGLYQVEAGGIAWQFFAKQSEGLSPQEILFIKASEADSALLGDLLKQYVQGLDIGYEHAVGSELENEIIAEFLLVEGVVSYPLALAALSLDHLCGASAGPMPEFKHQGLDCAVKKTDFLLVNNPSI